MRLHIRRFAAFAAALIGLAGAEASPEAAGSAERVRAVASAPDGGAGSASLPDAPPPSASGRAAPRAVLRAAPVGAAGPLSSPAPAMAGAMLAAVSGARSGSQFPAREASASFWDAAHAHPACAP